MASGLAWLIINQKFRQEVALCSHCFIVSVVLGLLCYCFLFVFFPAHLFWVVEWIGARSDLCFCLEPLFSSLWTLTLLFSLTIPAFNWKLSKEHKKAVLGNILLKYSWDQGLTSSTSPKCSVIFSHYGSDLELRVNILAHELSDSRQLRLLVHTGLLCSILWASLWAGHPPSVSFPQGHGWHSVCSSWAICLFFMCLFQTG